jgi:predicted membrane-bound dolichyl-phosphate-mannose-protein mannosyltransferase
VPTDEATACRLLHDDVDDVLAVEVALVAEERLDAVVMVLAGGVGAAAILILVTRLSGGKLWAGIFAAALFATDPLLWFYGEIAEIYPSEVLVTLLVAFSAWRTLRGRPVWIYLCAVALAVRDFGETKFSYGSYCLSPCSDRLRVEGTGDRVG